MRRLSSVILILLLSLSLAAQKSPHGDNFVVSCSDCHKTDGWKVDLKTITYDHNATKFPLKGQHQIVNCKQCHTSLEFAKVQKECNECHTDIHQQTVGQECSRCHTPNSWIVNDITKIHQQSRFPLLGAHAVAACSDCHTNVVPSAGTPSSPTASLLRFDPLGVECYDCHSNNYLTATRPNHVESNYSTNCTECHKINSFTWTGASTDHSFFPLTDGHAINDCGRCHKSTVYSNISADCISCHQPQYSATSNPNHNAIGISNACATCHSTKPGWEPATFPTHNNYYILAGAHIPLACADCHNGNYNNTPNTCEACHITIYNQTTDPNHAAAQFPKTCADCHSQSAWTPATFDHDGQYFPVYSGKHKGVWNSCSECHTNSSNYAVFTCTTSCHPQSETNNQHEGVGGYQYASDACLACHPTGNSGGSFNHNSSSFPLTGGHSTVNCASCHTNGYSGTSNVCASCHITNYNQSTNPNHIAIGISDDCALCHTTNPGWNPATFPTHNNYYVLAGAHIPLACADCHNGNYNNTPNTCADCHITNYNQTTDPNHTAAQFPTTCADCHSQSAWTPATFDHDGQYFPIYSGKHNGEWNSCSDCHPNPANFSVFTCTTSCHQQSSTNNDHQGVSGYSYNSAACFSCHPNGSSGGKMMINHNNERRD